MKILLRRVIRNCKRYLALTDFLEFLLLAVACVLAVNTVSESASLAIVLGLIYLILLVVKIVLSIRLRRANDRIQAEVLWGIFDVLTKSHFGKDLPVRFTLFKVDPCDSDRIIPWYRYQAGAGTCPIMLASKSRASYARNEGFTGQAWARPGKLIAAIMPVFESHLELEAYYFRKWNVTEEVARSLSDYMVEVGLILSWGLVDDSNRFLGVLSIDIQGRICCKNPATVEFKRGRRFVIKGKALLTTFALVQNVLRSFARVH